VHIPENIPRNYVDNCFTSSAKAVYITSVISLMDAPSVHVVLADTKKNAYFLTNDFYSFFFDECVYYYPSPTDKNELKEATAKVQRTATLSALNSFEGASYAFWREKTGAGSFVITDRLMNMEYNSRHKPVLIITYPDALDLPVLNKSEIKSSILSIKKGERLSHEFIKEVLYDSGFEKVDFTAEPGQFALRGGIIDIFSFADNLPVRIDFFGDQVESIRRFDINTQLSKENLESVDIFPDIHIISDNSSLVPFWEILPENSVLWDLRGENPTGENYVIPQPTFNKNFEILSQDIRSKMDHGYTVTILSPNEAQTDRLRQILVDTGEKVRPDFLPLSLHEGYVDKISKNCYYTDHQIFERYHKVKVKRQVERSERLTINEIMAFRIGDYVVHIDYGVGKFGGLVKTNVNGKIQEAIKLVYKDNDVVFVSIHGIHRISKYKSRDGEPPKIYKLGTKAWDNLKSRTKSKVKDIVEDLIKLYSARHHSKGFAFSADNFLMHELESSFMYEDTPDQALASKKVKEDMESDLPMDRLVCGDVGFGKTEVAIRAAFKAVCDSKQVAVLVPTTILALQHYHTFSSRLKDFPCRVEYISRLRNTKEISRILEELHAGRVDILIGTHRILNKKVLFKDLGLLIIDEEQKFGVSSKEKIRQMRSNIDTLTLTATPIPRTLQFSLLGARDLSIINTPPPNRKPVYTEVINFNDEVITDIINSELERGGQVFFVHNRIEDILSVRDILQRLVPQAQICVAHGQMEPEILEKRIVEFIAGEHDILLATTIIENGIDIPNANTMIINQAQRFGLSDLHQLRGRVGRSNVKAFCYLLIPPIASITDDARRRIRAIEAFSELGSGFNIAMQDLDIRGAGNLLGAEQSGFIAEMGFETYMRILNEAMSELREEKVSKGEDTALPDAMRSAPMVDTQIETDLEAYIPDEYVQVTSEKIRLYKDLTNISDERQIEALRREMEDRFGPIPEQVDELIRIVQLKKVAQNLGFEKIILKNGVMLAYFISNNMHSYYRGNLFPEILTTIQSLGDRCRVNEVKGKLYIRVKSIPDVRQAILFLSKLI
jgi:transcription-repair coupling factor (superfamily II helicase)